MKILTIVGARPQFIKSAPVSRALAAAGLQEVLLHTGQHYDPNMSDVFFRELGLRAPDLDLGAGPGSHAEQTAAMLVGIERAIVARQPDWVLVYGDTNSTLAGALAASKLQVPVAHVEAGMRSFNRRMPEEVNRIVADRLSSLLFTPTPAASRNLRHEGFAEADILEAGDVMYDAVLMFREKARSASRILEDLRLAPKSYILATIHRAENTDAAETLLAIVNGLALAARQVPVIMPLHPRTRQALDRLPRLEGAGIQFMDPLGFLDMQRLEMEARVIATDSGGVQKEAFWHGVRCVTLRTETEWVELTEAGVNQLCNPRDSEAICDLLLHGTFPPSAMKNLPGSGGASDRIAARLRAGKPNPGAR